MQQQQRTIKVALCLVGCLHLATFASLLAQNCHLFGSNGVQPVAAFLRLAAEQVLPTGSSYTQNILTMLTSHPTLLWLHPLLGISPAALLDIICTAGVVVSFAAACGVLHPCIFALLWALYLSVQNVGQAFLPQPGDTVLLEMTFACIWLAQSLSSMQPTADQTPMNPLNERQDQQQQQTSVKAWISATTPASLFMRWLLFKLLLLSSNNQAAIVCSAVSDLKRCYHAMLAHGHPHFLTWWFQALSNPFAAFTTALSLLQGPAAFLALCTSPTMQQPAAKLLFFAQLFKVCVGTMTLADAAAAVLCITLMQDSMVTAGMRHLKELYAGKQQVSKAGAEAPLSAAEQELMGYKTNGHGHKRTPSNDSLASLASLLEEPEQRPTLSQGSQQPAGIFSNRTNRITLGIAAAVAAVLFNVNNAAQLVLRWRPAQITTALHILVPGAAAVWGAVIAYAAHQFCKRAVAEAAAMAAKLAASKAAMQRSQSIAGSSGAAAAKTVTKPYANGVVAAASPVPLSPTVGASAVAAEVPVRPALPAIATKIAATEAEADTAKPARRGRTTAAKAAADSATPTGTPRRSARARTSTHSEDNADGTAAEDSAATGTPKAARGRRTTAARGRKTAAAAAASAIAEENDGADGHADGMACFYTPEAAAAPDDAHAAAAPVTPAVPAAATAPKQPAVGEAAKTPAGSAAAATQVGSSNKDFDLGSWLTPKLHVGRAVLATTAVLAVFIAGLPAVLIPAGYTPATLQSVPGLLRSYRFVHSYGMVSSDANMQLALKASAAAAQQVPGSYLVYEFSTSEDHTNWQPVVFKQGMSEAGPGFGLLRGLYDHRLQGKLVAAGSGDLAENMWLLNLADKLLEGKKELAGVLAQPLTEHEWVRIDLMRYIPSCIMGSSQPNSLNTASSQWLVEELAAVLPPVQRGDADVKAMLTELGWQSHRTGSSCTGGLLGVPSLVVVLALLAAVAIRHTMAPGGVLYELEA